MPTAKFSSFEQAAADLRLSPPTASVASRMRTLFELSARLAPVRYTPGVRKFHSLEEAAADRSGDDRRSVLPIDLTRAYNPGMTLNEAFRQIGEALLAEVRRHYGERLVSLVVYGSVGRGTMRPDSDIDILIVADALPPGRIPRVNDFAVVEERLAPLLERFRREGVATEFSPVFKTPEEAMHTSPLFLDMVEDALILHDRGGFFGGVLDRLRSRMAALGSRRIWRGNAWYWDLKPDYQPGEIFEL